MEVSEYNNVLQHLQNLCVKRECCRSEILKKAEKALGGDRERAAEMVEALISDKFVDDARYACAFAREKSSLTGWGPAKIRYALMMKGISQSDIIPALSGTDTESARKRLVKLCEAKWKSLQGDPYARFKLIKYALSRGYEYEEVRATVEEICR